MQGMILRWGASLTLHPQTAILTCSTEVRLTWSTWRQPWNLITNSLISMQTVALHIMYVDISEYLPKIIVFAALSRIVESYKIENIWTWTDEEHANEKDDVASSKSSSSCSRYSRYFLVHIYFISTGCKKILSGSVLINHANEPGKDYGTPSRIYSPDLHKSKV